MKLYHSPLAPVGERWTGTQADAKAANQGDKNFATVEVPDAKADRIAWLNTFEKDLHDAHPPVPIIAEGVVDPEEIKGIQMDARPVVVVAREDKAAPMPVRTVDIMNRTAIEEALWASEEHGLKLLEECIAARRQELVKATEPAGRDTVNPPKRRRAAI